MSNDWLDELNQNPVSYGAVLVMGTLAYLTGSLGMTMNSQLLQDYGSCSGLLVMAGEPWRLLSASLLHGNLVHIAFCGYMILSLGPRLEQTLGSLRFLLLWIVCALGGSVATCLYYLPQQPVVGSSGVVFGMLGAALAINIRGGRSLLDFTQDRGSRHLISLVVVNLLLGWLISFISSTAHIGGLLAGFVFTLFFLVPDRRESPSPRSRLIQAALLLLFGSYTWLALHPVYKRDYLFREYLLSPDPKRRSELGTILRQIPAPASDPDSEFEPRTGIPIYGYLEALPIYERAIANWKAASPWLR